MRTIKLLSIILVIAILSVPGMAEYYVSAQIEQVVRSGSDGNNSWSTPYQFSLNKSDPPLSVYGVTINLYDLGNSNTMALFRISGGTLQEVGIEKSKSECIKGTCISAGGAPQNLGDVRLTLKDIIQGTTQPAATISDNPVYAYLYANKELALTRDGNDIFDATAYFAQDTGWSSDKKDREVNVYFRRNSKIPASVSVSTTVRKPRIEEDPEKIKFIIEESGTYVFTVKYNRQSAWGFTTEETEKYTLTIKGIAPSGNGNSIPVASGTYDVYLPNSKVLTMSQPGTFENVNGVTITDIGENKYRFSFDSAGSYRLIYKSGIEEAKVEFNVMAGPTTAQTAQDTYTGAQVQDDESSTSTYFIIAAIIALVAMLIFVLMKRKKGPVYRHTTQMKPTG